MMLPLPRGTGGKFEICDSGLSTQWPTHPQNNLRRGDTLPLPFNDPNLDKEATTNGPEAKNEGQDIREER
jgi:hypothetical protein